MTPAQMDPSMEQPCLKVEFPLRQGARTIMI
jgi:hypothetical protein